MIITCKNIRDFCELINISIGQDVQPKCIFVSFESSYPSITFIDSIKNHKSFTFAFSTPLYTAIYDGNIECDVFDKEYTYLKELCSSQKIHIHIFDELKYDTKNNSLSIETHIDTI